MANSEEIRDSLEDSLSDKSELSIYRNLSDSDDPEYEASSDYSDDSIFEDDPVPSKRRRIRLENNEHNYALQEIFSNLQPSTSAQDSGGSSEEVDQIQITQDFNNRNIFSLDRN
ncbi:hypothetical protein J6590_103350 [Homalodisca vitripennis]|nr:hypothetical protein J6590_103350 [Homalodisca vitripennis]